MIFKKGLPLLLILLALVFGCDDNRATKESIIRDSTNKEHAKIIGEGPVIKEKIFNEVSGYPVIRDSTQFIADLISAFDLEVEESPVQQQWDKITTYEKIKLYGSDKEFYFIEYNYAAGSMATYPWKYQLVLTADGKLVKALTADRFEFVSVFPKHSPFLLTVIRSAKGNGGHEVYKIASDTMENVYEGYYDYEIRTYDKHQDTDVYEPNELKLQFKDDNKDGFKDMIFTGKRLMLGRYTKDSSWYDVEIVDGREVPFTVDHPGKVIPIKYVFLYDRRSGHFKAKENYGTEE